MKIILISQSVSPGFLIFRIDFIRYLVSSGHSVYCFAPDYTSESKCAVEQLGAIPVEYSLSKAGFNALRDIRDILVLSKKIKAIQPDVTFCFFVKPSIYGTLAGKIAGVPRRIAMLEGLGYIHTPLSNGFNLKKKLLQYIHGLLCTVGYFFADKVLFLNASDPVDLCRYAFINKRKLVHVGPIGLDLKEFSYRQLDLAKPMRFIFIARLLVEKGTFEYLDAARIVKRTFPETEFVILGELDFENPAALTSSQLQSVIDENLIIYPGHVSDVASWIADSHVFVLPSYREGFPRSTQEAMAIGRAVLTTDVPGCRETVKNDVNGFIVPPFAAEKLAEKMVYFIKHPEAVKRMGDESHRIAVSRFDVHKINPILAEIVIGDG